MLHTFERDGIHFQYPAGWAADADEDADGGGWTVTVQSPEPAFLLVSLRPEADTPADLADQALDALQAEYKELDATNAVETLAGRPAVGHDIDFLTLDTSVTCCTRCLDTPAGPVLVMWQTSEHDRARNESVLRAACASLTVDED